jgi:hypothetical protein
MDRASFLKRNIWVGVRGERVGVMHGPGNGEGTERGQDRGDGGK